MLVLKGSARKTDAHIELDGDRSRSDVVVEIVVEDSTLRTVDSVVFDLGSSRRKSVAILDFELFNTMRAELSELRERLKFTESFTFDENESSVKKEAEQSTREGKHRNWRTETRRS